MKSKTGKVGDLGQMDSMQFRIPASDTKGHTNRMYFRCQPGHSHQVSVMLDSKKFPYRTKGDLLRHALVRHLDWLGTQAPVPSIMAEVDTILEIMRDEQFAQEFAIVFDKMGQRIATHLGGGSQGEALRL